MKRSLLSIRLLNKRSRNMHIVCLLPYLMECYLHIRQAAEKLYIHRNTLIYRLKKIKQDTGYDPQISQDAVSLRLAVWIYRTLR
ncbi:PucR family transcriptional regulator [Aneurinibacillus aneurinilyticus]|uniref:PucR family transcriptional regulator n=1 Tax=Aneurinibacillus aneurinilyticus TaxID=1391 RepID=A0A848CVQ0_ANEAE|nr:PucR family transcriptional regulator [Aneurinibacillus aneurinilyticus]